MTLVADYFRRIGIDRPERADLAALRAIHAAHVSSIPFENLDILLGRGIQLDLEHLRAKLVDGGRGGYCFEHNTLLRAVLAELGFTVHTMEARVRAGAAVERPRTHMVLVVDLGEEEWLADVGFGGDGPFEPVPMDGTIAAQGALEYQVASDGPACVLRLRAGEGPWLDQYVFLPQPVLPVDFEMANWFTSTHPRSPFVNTLTAQRTTRDVRYLLRYPTYTEVRSGVPHTRTITRSELLPLLRDVFHIDLPDATTFRAID
jgi:N-hydroxyarylamine O-acetyltransferase